MHPLNMDPLKREEVRKQFSIVLNRSASVQKDNCFESRMLLYEVDYEEYLVPSRGEDGVSVFKRLGNRSADCFSVLYFCRPQNYLRFIPRQLINFIFNVLQCRRKHSGPHVVLWKFRQHLIYSLLHHNSIPFIYV